MSAREDIMTAVKLLEDDNLVWSQDFELVRSFLAAMLTFEASKPEPRIDCIVVARKLIGE